MGASGFFKKIGSAFVEMPEGDAPEAEAVSEDELNALLAASGVEELTSDPTAPATPTASTPAPAPKQSPLDWTLAQVFDAGGVEASRNSAQTVLTLLAGLAAIPDDQRLVAVRAMDAADDGWDEDSVLTDATKRLQVLQHYGQYIDKDEADRIANVEALAQEWRGR